MAQDIKSIAENLINVHFVHCNMIVNKLVNKIAKRIHRYVNIQNYRE